MVLRQVQRRAEGGIVKALGRRVLRQEDTLAVTQLDCQLVIFMKIKSQQSDQGMDWSVTSSLLATRNHWRETKEKGAKSLGQQLRTVLFSSWLTAIKFRTQEISTNFAAKEQALKMWRGRVLRTFSGARGRAGI